jgi:ATP-dependent DNA helicase DinG
MLDPEVKQEIQTAYSQFLKSRELKPRHGQKLMIAEIAKMLGGIELDAMAQRRAGTHIALVEAGTGTGKTIAYLIASLPFAKKLGKKVVLSTATIALQEQILLKDLPELIEHSDIRVKVCLAKGRSRYLCPAKLERIIQDAKDASAPLYEDEHSDVSGAELSFYYELLDASGEGQWDGDRDNWPKYIEDTIWYRVTTDHRQCSGRKCPHIRHCPFYLARAELEDADCIIANHDLMLSDLALGGGAILSPPEDTIYILDEGHHLPSKALSHFSRHARLRATARWLGQVEQQWEKTSALLSDCENLLRLGADFPEQLRSLRLAHERVLPLIEALTDKLDFDRPNPRHRFELGEVDAGLEAEAQQMSSGFLALLTILEKLTSELEAIAEEQSHSLAPAEIEQVSQQTAIWHNRVESNYLLWSSYSQTAHRPDAPMARWISVLTHLDTVDYEIVSSPILASDLLIESLWSRCFASVVTSATLTALQSFDRFKMHSGIDDAACLRVLSPFDFAGKAELRIPAESVEANRAEEHTSSLIDLLPDLIDEGEGTLLLFASGSQMRSVFEDMPSRIQHISLVQGEESKQALVRQHKKAIDEGRGSALWGLASFAEGVDLPGAYCRHVIIAKLPFAVPDDPLEAALSEWIEARGGNAFMEIAVPDTSMRLVQAAGRLLRTERDEGAVTILDKRLLTKRYGKALLDSLPPFKREFG